MQMVIPKFERAQRMQHRPRQQLQVRQEGREACGQREAQLEQQLANVQLVRGRMRADEALEQRGQQRQLYNSLYSRSNLYS